MKRFRRSTLVGLSIGILSIIGSAAFIWDREIIGNSWITLYGRVADVQDTPLPNAVVHLSIIHHKFFNIPVPMVSGPGSENIDLTLTSDTNGNFSLKGWNGVVVLIRGIDKPGFVWRNEMIHPIRGQDTVASRFAYSAAEGRDQSLPLTPQMRVTFVLTPATVPSPVTGIP